MDWDWKKINIPLGVAVAVTAGLISGYAYMQTTFVMAADFSQYQVRQEKLFRRVQRSHQILYLERDIKKLETDKLILDVKQNTSPSTYSPVDKALHNKVAADLEEAKKELRELKQLESQDR